MGIVPAAVAILSLSLAVPALARADNQISWGKAGVTYKQYREDAITCGHVAWHEDVSGTKAAQVFRTATRRLESDGVSAVDSARIVESVRPEMRLREVRGLQYEVLGQCLRDRGYVRFQLNDEQQRKLRKLRSGKSERHRYLHSLGSDGRVIAAQKI
jgi:hypothetical protein